MANSNKSPVDIIQEFIALQNTRKEAAQRMGIKETGGRFQQVVTSAENAIAELMSELSEVGDASKSDIDKGHKSIEIWNKAVPDIEHWTLEQKEETFSEMETALKESYLRTLSKHIDLPDSLRERLERQSSEL